MDGVYNALIDTASSLESKRKVKQRYVTVLTRKRAETYPVVINDVVEIKAQDKKQEQQERGGLKRR